MHNSKGIFICERKNTCEILTRLGLENNNTLKSFILSDAKLSKNDGGDG